MVQQTNVKKILIIDDERVFREVMTEFLKKENYIVSAAEDGQRGIACAKNERFDLIILDIYMPGLSGLDTMLALQKFCPDVPVIMVTATDSAENYREAMRLGASDYLLKPITREKLERSLGSIFDRQQQAQSEIRWLRGFERLKKSTELLRDSLAQHSSETTLNIDEFINRIVSLIAEVLDVKTVSVLKVNNKTQYLELLGSHGLDEKVITKTPRLVGEGISGFVAQTGEPLLVTDVRDDPRFKESRFSSQYQTPSLLCVPIVVEGRVEGVINANNKTDGSAFDDKDLGLLSMFAHNVESLMSHINLTQQLQERLKDLTLLYHINRKITESLDVNQSIKEMLSSVHYAFGAEMSSLLMLKEDKERLYYKAVIGDKWGLVKHYELEIGEGFAGWTARYKQSILAHDAPTDPRFSPRLDRYIGFKSRNSLAVPIVVHDQTIGVIELINKKNEQSFTEREQTLLETIAAQTGLALRNAWLHTNLEEKVKEAMETQTRETKLKTMLKQKMQEIDRLKNDSVITFRIEDD